MPSSPDETIDLETRVVASDRQITSQLGDESIILDLDKGVYFGLDAIGSRIWTMLETPCSAREVCDVLQQEYEVAPAECEEAILALFQDLHGRALIESADEVC
jgi:hypothetical protein